MPLEAWLQRAAPRFRRWDQTREGLLTKGRQLVRDAGALIRALHRGQHDTAAWRSLDIQAKALLHAVAQAPEFSTAGFVQQSLGEYAEARILEAFGHEPPRFAPLLAKLPGDALLLGIADTIGELRRRLLDELARDDMASAQRAFDQMESLFQLLSDAEAPEALVGLRAKRDAARGILERSRGDLVIGKKTKQLEKKIDDVKSLLDEAEGTPASRRKRVDPDDLDLDAAWSKKS